MPALADTDPPIRPAMLTGRSHPMHPSPSRDGLALEILSAKELGYWGQQFGVDRPYYFVFLGWGEVEPVMG